MYENCWLPEIIRYDSKFNSWSEYESFLYSVFTTDFIQSRPTYKMHTVEPRWYPVTNNREEGFYHITGKKLTHSGDRVPDLRRCERIRWVRSFIENVVCNPLICSECDGVKIWNEPFKNTIRPHLLFEEECYVVVLEKRNKYYLLISAFYVEREKDMDDLLDKYEELKED